MSPPATRILAPDEAGIAEAARLIREGELVAVPTETVYGLAADATNAAAVAKIYHAKGRPSFNPLIVHVLDMAQAKGLGALPDEAAERIAEHFWPGPLTLVVPLSPFTTSLAREVSAGLDTIALRSPAHPVMRRVLEAVGKPLAAPSANASGRISPTRAAHVLASLEDRIAAVIDAGPTERGLESTIVKVADGVISVLREGPIPSDEVAVLGKMRVQRKIDWKIEAPGMMASHYAPAKPLRLNATSAEDGEILIGYGPVKGDLYLGEELATAAARLFDLMHQADAAPQPRIAIAPIPEEDVGVAINDRLRRAAAPR